MAELCTRPEYATNTARMLIILTLAPTLTPIPTLPLAPNPYVGGRRAAALLRLCPRAPRAEEAQGARRRQGARQLQLQLPLTATSTVTVTQSIESQ